MGSFAALDLITTLAPFGGNLIFAKKQKTGEGANDGDYRL
jgi:hypothetical protein